jgi:ATP-dependent protease ClpP protease subunit
MTEEEYSSGSKDDWWMSADEAVKLNMVDKIVDKELYQSLL